MQRLRGRAVVDVFGHPSRRCRRPPRRLVPPRLPDDGGRAAGARGRLVVDLRVPHRRRRWRPRWYSHSNSDPSPCRQDCVQHAKMLQRGHPHGYLRRQEALPVVSVGGSGQDG